MENYYTHQVCVPPEVHYHEIEYYRRELEIARRIISQLTNPKPWDVVFVHPADLCEMINNLDIADRFHMLDRKEGHFGEQFTFKGKMYVQTTLVPAKTENYR